MGMCQQIQQEVVLVEVVGEPQYWGRRSSAVGGLCLHPLTPNLSVLSNAMPSSVSTTQKCLLTRTSTMSVGQLLLSMGCGTGLQVWCKWRLSPIWEFVLCGECASVQPGWSCVGMSFGKCDMAIISRSRRHRDYIWTRNFLFQYLKWRKNGLLLNCHNATNERFG